MNREKLLSTTLLSVRLLLGTMLIAAAFMKLLSIDYFEIYIYSFNIFSFALTTVVSRILIAAEILLGLELILKIFYKKAWWLSMLMMVGFTLFLIYVIAFRNDENCHCFGELVKLNPSESIYKNIVSILLLLVIRNEDDYKYRPKLKKWLFGITITISFFIPFVVFPMDMLYNKMVSKDKNINTMAFERSLKDTINIIHLQVSYENDSLIIVRDSLVRYDISSDKYIINYISAGCKFCKMGAKKMMMIMNHNSIDHKHLIFMVWGHDADILGFINETETLDCEYWYINPMTSLDITFGKFPVYVWSDKGEILNTGDMRDLNENQISDFLR